MAGERKITVTFDGKDVGLKKAADDAVDTVKSSGDSIGSAFKGVGTVAGGFLVAELTSKLTDWASDGLSWLWDGTKLATDTKESMNKVDVVFGQSAGTIKDFAKGAAQNIGLSERAALDATGTFGNMFDQLGFGATLGADMSTSMLTLSADIASFHNADITDVIEAQTSAFRGEYDSLQKFIPTINAAAVEQEAMTLSGKKSADQLTDQEKAMGAFNLMLVGSGKASGDFAATMDSQANQERIAAAEAENLQASLGEKLLPVTEAVTAAKRKLVEVLANDLIPWVTEAATTLNDTFGPALTQIKDSFTTFIAAFQEGESFGGGGIFDVMGEAGATLGNAWRDLVDTYNNELKPALEDLAAKGREIIEDIDWQTVWQELQPILAAAGGAFMSFMTMAITAIGTVISNITTFITKLQEMWREHESFRIIVTGVWDFISTKVTTALNVMSGVMKLITAVMSGDWSAAWNAIKQIASNAWNSLTADFRGMANTIRSIGGAMWNPISSGLSSVVSNVESQINRLIRAYNSIPFLPNVSTISTGPARQLSVNSIPKFASGGLAFGPTLAMVGDNPGAWADPEVTAPLSKLSGLGGAGGDAVHVQVNIDGQTLFDILRKGVRNRGGIDVVFA